MSIYEAETRRISGAPNGLLEARQQAKNKARVEPSLVTTVSKAESNELMAYWRIWVSSCLGLANWEKSGPEAAGYLHEAHDVIQNYYFAQPVRIRAAFMTQDSRGSEYKMAAEMGRDTAKYWFRVGTLLGNYQIRRLSLGILDEVIEDLSTTGDSVNGLAIIEKSVAQRKLGLPMDISRFKSAYREVVKKSPLAGGWDRMAASSWEFMRECLLRGDIAGAFEGQRNLQNACSNMGKNWLIYPGKELIQLRKDHSRRQTGAGAHEKAIQRKFKIR